MYRLRTRRGTERDVPKFVQIMEFKTSRIDEVEALSKRMQEDRGDSYLASKATITEDRDRPGTYVVIIEFDSYEIAMKNSNDPETDKTTKELGTLLDGPPKFYNLDVRMEM
jgi:uncharacterized protein (DUF1330 family)